MARIEVPWYVKLLTPVVGAGIGFVSSGDWIGSVIGAVAAPVVGHTGVATYNALHAEDQEEAKKPTPVKKNPLDVALDDLGDIIDEVKESFLADCQKVKETMVELKKEEAEEEMKFAPSNLFPTRPPRV